jgi:ATP-dependent protease ClpP protease subunit
MSMISTIKNAAIPVATIVQGKAMSCGAVLFSFGKEKYRFISRDSTLMIHDVSSGISGKIEEIKADAEEANRLNNSVYEMMAKNCGHKKDYFLKIVHDHSHADWFLNASEAKKHNLANHIRIPVLTISVNVDINVK